MSKMYGSMAADMSKRPATKRANKYISAHVRSYTLGIEVIGSEDKDGVRRFKVYETQGSGSSFFSGKLVYSCEEEAVK